MQKGVIQKSAMLNEMTLSFEQLLFCIITEKNKTIHGFYSYRLKLRT